VKELISKGNAAIYLSIQNFPAKQKKHAAFIYRKINAGLINEASKLTGSLDANKNFITKT